MAGYNEIFSRVYDGLMGEVDYGARADFLLAQLARHGKPSPQLVLDLACGTGSLAVELARRGLEVIGVDGSQEMLSVAMSKSAGVTPPVLFLCQRMEQLDLYGTVEAAFCTLDSLNHLSGIDSLERVLGRLHHFIEPGGLFVFDLNTPYKHRQVLGSNTFVYDTPEVYCVWQNTPGPDDSVDISLDFFLPLGGGRYRRQAEQFREVVYPREQLLALLEDQGFRLLEELGDYRQHPPGPEEERILYIAQRK